MSTDINAPIVAVDLSDYGCLRKNEGKVIRRMPIEGFRRLSDCLRIRRWIEQGAADNLCF
ncbi:MAG: hypothetical protein GX409_09555 [candidate division Zixibacteria bacterium]|nr:hypothetical protein [candidate division Zixibacteria bacterium]